MSVALEHEIIHLRQTCRVEDAEPLLTLLQAGPARVVDLTQAAHLHAAVVQVLLALRPVIMGPIGDPFAETWLRAVLSPVSNDPRIGE